MAVAPDKRTLCAARCEISDCVFANLFLCEECVTYGYQYKRNGATQTWPIQACKSCRVEGLFTQDSRLSKHMATVFLESHVRASSTEPWLMDVIYPEVTKPLVSTSANAIGLRCFVCSADASRPLRGQFHVCTNVHCPAKHREMCQICAFLWTGQGTHLCPACGDNHTLIDTSEEDESGSYSNRGVSSLLSKIDYIASASSAAVTKCESCGINYKSPDTEVDINRQPYQWLRRAGYNCQAIGAICRACIRLSTATIIISAAGANVRCELRNAEPEELSAISMVCQVCQDTTLDHSVEGVLWQIVPKGMALQLAKNGVPARDGVLKPFDDHERSLRGALKFDQPKVSVVLSPGFLEARQEGFSGVAPADRALAALSPGALDGVTFRLPKGASPSTSRHWFIDQPMATSIGVPTLSKHCFVPGSQGASPCACCGMTVSMTTRRLACGVSSCPFRGIYTCALYTRYKPQLQLITCCRCHPVDASAEPHPSAAMMQAYRLLLRKAALRHQLPLVYPRVIYREMDSRDVAEYSLCLLGNNRPVRCPVCPRITAIKQHIAFQGCNSPLCVLRYRTLCSFCLANRLSLSMINCICGLPLVAAVQGESPAPPPPPRRLPCESCGGLRPLPKSESQAVSLWGPCRGVDCPHNRYVCVDCLGNGVLCEQCLPRHSEEYHADMQQLGQHDDNDYSGIFRFAGDSGTASSSTEQCHLYGPAGDHRVTMRGAFAEIPNEEIIISDATGNVARTQTSAPEPSKNLIDAHVPTCPTTSPAFRPPSLPMRRILRRGSARSDRHAGDPCGSLAEPCCVTTSPVTVWLTFRRILLWSILAMCALGDALLRHAPLMLRITVLLAVWAMPTAAVRDDDMTMEEARRAAQDFCERSRLLMPYGPAPSVNRTLAQMMLVPSITAFAMLVAHIHSGRARESFGMIFTQVWHYAAVMMCKLEHNRSAGLYSIVERDVASMFMKMRLLLMPLERARRQTVLDYDWKRCGCCRCKMPQDSQITGGQCQHPLCPHTRLATFNCCLRRVRGVLVCACCRPLMAGWEPVSMRLRPPTPGPVIAQHQYMVPHFDTESPNHGALTASFDKGIRSLPDSVVRRIRRSHPRRLPLDAVEMIFDFRATMVHAALFMGFWIRFAAQRRELHRRKE